MSCGISVVIILCYVLLHSPAEARRVHVVSNSSFIRMAVSPRKALVVEAKYDVEFPVEK